MRYIPANCLRPGQVLAADLIMDGYKVLLRRGIRLTDVLIRRIEQIGFQGVYVADDLSQDLEVFSVISDSLKHKANREVQAFYISLQNRNESKTRAQLDTISDVISNMVDEILKNRKLMVNVVDLRTFDDYTFSHSVNVAVLSAVTGAVLGLSRSKLHALAMGALIHDIGKVFIDRRVINKPDLLTDTELMEVRRHSELGYNHLRGLGNIPENTLLAVLTHHEQFNGGGYPRGLVGETIPLFGRIICVADVYDALTSDRPYRRAMLPSDAIEYLMAGFDTIFDPKVVRAFCRKVAPYPVGTCVRLSNGQMGIVVKNYELSSMRPKIRLIEDGHPTKEYLNLTSDPTTLNVTIKEIVQL